MSNFVIKTVAKKKKKRSVINMGTKIFNGLPLESKSVENFNVLRGNSKIICCTALSILFKSFPTNVIF
jgi:hypothetical protein